MACPTLPLSGRHGARDGVARELMVACPLEGLVRRSEVQADNYCIDRHRMQRRNRTNKIFSVLTGKVEMA
jgi:hypothetical protein